MELTPELIRKHMDCLLEVTVKAHTATSKKGKIYNVKQHERDIKNMSNEELKKEIRNKGPLQLSARTELRSRLGSLPRGLVKKRKSRSKVKSKFNSDEELKRDTKAAAAARRALVQKYYSGKK